MWHALTHVGTSTVSVARLKSDPAAVHAGSDVRRVSVPLSINAPPGRSAQSVRSTIRGAGPWEGGAMALPSTRSFTDGWVFFVAVCQRVIRAPPRRGSGVVRQTSDKADGGAEWAADRRPRRHGRPATRAAAAAADASASRATPRGGNGGDSVCVCACGWGWQRQRRRRGVAAPTSATLTTAGAPSGRLARGRWRRCPPPRGPPRLGAPRRRVRGWRGPPAVHSGRPVTGGERAAAACRPCACERRCRRQWRPGNAGPNALVAHSRTHTSCT